LLLLGDPPAEVLHALDVQAARSALTVDPLLDEPAAAEDPDVAGDGLVRQVEWFGELADGRFAPSQPGDDLPTGSVAEGGECGIQVDVGSDWHRQTLSATFSLYKVSVAKGAWPGSEQVTGRYRPATNPTP
jgi:hypothetical protein